jgi:hypothetical protein
MLVVRAEHSHVYKMLITGIQHIHMKMQHTDYLTTVLDSHKGALHST